MQKNKQNAFPKSTIVLIVIFSIICALYQTNSAKTYPSQVDLSQIDSGVPPSTWYAGDSSFKIQGSLTAPTAESFQSISQDNEKMEFSFQCTGNEITSVPIGLVPPLVSSEQADLVGSNELGNLVIDTSDCDRGEFKSSIIQPIPFSATGQSLLWACLISSFIFAFASYKVSSKTKSI